MNRKPWPKPWGAVVGFLAVALFVTWPEIRHGWRPDVLPHLAISGAVGAVVGWLMVYARNKVMT